MLRNNKFPPLLYPLIAGFDGSVLVVLFGPSRARRTTQRRTGGGRDAHVDPRPADEKGEGSKEAVLLPLEVKLTGRMLLCLF